MQLYNTLSRRKESFKPLTPGKVGLYACGVTVYDEVHLGHARSSVAFDVLVRYLVRQGFHDPVCVIDIALIEGEVVLEEGVAESRHSQ